MAAFTVAVDDCIELFDAVAPPPALAAGIRRSCCRRHSRPALQIAPLRSAEV